VSLFDTSRPGPQRGVDRGAPLAARMRPRTLDEFVGQEHLVGPGKPLRLMIERDDPASIIFWGPPGVGKTTLAQIIANATHAEFIEFSAVLAGIKEIKQVMADADKARQFGTRTIVFVDEVHRFNKAQQDAFLPYVEKGSIRLIGATTENPSFEIIGALLSRARVYVLKALQASDIRALLERALTDRERGLGDSGLSIEPEALDLLAQAGDGDARRALGMLELASGLASTSAERTVTLAQAREVAAGGRRRFDKGGEQFYDQISALHKAVRGSDPDAALYWYARMIDGGCDPPYIARRVLRMASEDIGLADPRALTIALEAWQAFERLGSPEGELAIAEAVVYMAVAAKSNALYTGMNAAMADAEHYGSLPVPLQLRNAPTKLMKELGYGSGYRYAHDEPGAFAAGERYLPDEMPDRRYYEPAPRGLEIRIGEALARLRERNQSALSGTPAAKQK
jgi:putative ATPase